MSLLKIIKDFFGLDKSIEKKTGIDLDKYKYERAKNILLKENYFKELDELQQKILIEKLINNRQYKLDKLRKERKKYRLIKQKCSDIEQAILDEGTFHKNRKNKIKKYFLEKGMNVDCISNLRQLKQVYLDFRGITLNERYTNKDEFYLSKIKEFDDELTKKKNELKELRSKKIIIGESSIKNILEYDLKHDKSLSWYDASIISEVMLNNPKNYMTEIINAKQEVLQKKSEERTRLIERKIDQINELLKSKEKLENEMIDFNNSFNLVEYDEYVYRWTCNIHVPDGNFTSSPGDKELGNSACEEIVPNSVLESFKSLKYYFPDGLNGIVRTTHESIYCDVDRFYKMHEITRHFVSGHYYRFNQDIIPENDLELFNEYKFSVQCLENLLNEKENELPSSYGVNHNYLRDRIESNVDKIRSFIDELRAEN